MDREIKLAIIFTTILLLNISPAFQMTYLNGIFCIIKKLNVDVNVKRYPTTEKQQILVYN